MKQVVVTGAGGFLGYHLTKILADKGWQVIGTWLHKPIQNKQINAHQIDLTDTYAVSSWLMQLKPDAVIHAAAQGNANFCQQHPEESRKINVDSTVHLAGICKELNIPFVFTSTDLVFDGYEGFYGPNEQPQPLSEYGKQKAEAEQGTLKVYPTATICRLPLMYGLSGEFGKSFIHDFLEKWQNGETVKLFTDEYRTAADAASVSRGIELLLSKGLTGIWHLGGKERLSRFEFGEILAEVYEIENPGIEPVTHDMFEMAAPRPKDVSLNSLKSYAEGYAPLRTEVALQQIRQNILLNF